MTGVKPLRVRKRRRQCLKCDKAITAVEHFCPECQKANRTLASGLDECEIRMTRNGWKP